MSISQGRAIEDKLYGTYFLLYSGVGWPFSFMQRPLRLAGRGMSDVKPFHAPLLRSPLHSGGVAPHPVSPALVQVCCAQSTDEIKDLTRGWVVIEALMWHLHKPFLCLVSFTVLHLLLNAWWLELHSLFHCNGYSAHTCCLKPPSLICLFSRWPFAVVFWHYICVAGHFPSIYFLDVFLLYKLVILSNSALASGGQAHLSHLI